MTTALQARQAVRSRVETDANRPLDAGGVQIPLSWQNESYALPDNPAPFVHIEFDNDGPDGRGPTAFGGGQGQNLYRNRASVVAYVFVPKDEGLDEADSIAEQVATLFRSYRDSTISCSSAHTYPGGNGADIKPPGLDSEVGNYFYAIAEASLHFDLIG